jgi:hypothetical protein
MQTIKAEIDTNGVITLLEPVKIKRKARATVTVFDDLPEDIPANGTARSLLEFLRSNRLPLESKPTAEEIDAQIAEARDSWE